MIDNAGVKSKIMYIVPNKIQCSINVSYYYTTWIEIPKTN